MKIIHINHSDTGGGAARAAYRIHYSLLNHGVESKMYVIKSHSGDQSVNEIKNKNGNINRMYTKLNNLILKNFSTNNHVIHSTAFIPNKNLLNYINKSNADIIHLHWISQKTLSITDIAKINKPVVWTLHDMWPFCGAEHYTTDIRWQEGYHKSNRPKYESGFDLNKWTWHRKKRQWIKPMHIVAPSRWMSNCAEKSSLMRRWPISYISYPIDTNDWKPINQNIARDLLCLPKDVPLLLFGAIGGSKDPRKGFDLLSKALSHLKKDLASMQVIIFGQLRPRKSNNIGFKTHYTGHLHDDVSLKLLYSAADAFIMPSRQDNQPLTCMEALTCGTPVIAFDISGPPSMIKHKSNGYLAKAFDTYDLAEGIRWVLQDEIVTRRIGKEARKFAKNNFNEKLISKNYIELYNKILISK